MKTCHFIMSVKLRSGSQLLQSAQSTCSTSPVAPVEVRQDFVPASFIKLALRCIKSNATKAKKQTQKSIQQHKMTSIQSEYLRFHLTANADKFYIWIHILITSCRKRHADKQPVYQSAYESPTGYLLCHCPPLLEVSCTVTLTSNPYFVQMFLYRFWIANGSNIL